MMIPPILSDYPPTTVDQGKGNFGGLASDLSRRRRLLSNLRERHAVFEEQVWLTKLCTFDWIFFFSFFLFLFGVFFE